MEVVVSLSAEGLKAGHGRARFENMSSLLFQKALKEMS
jgi:hypothetical protein